ncbi:MAG: hypothetical protein JNM70_08680 [Anaerolineae bacterium]|nr:hypothetical protein [Anaerolineae bacterium]
MSERRPSTGSSTPDQSSGEAGKNIQRYVYLGAGGLGAIILVLFLIGLVLAVLTPVEATGARLSYIRNIFLIIMVLEGIVIIGAISTLIVQVTRLVNLLQRESRPILHDARQAVQQAKGTVGFVSETATAPIIRAGAFLAGVRVFTREVGGIRRAVRRTVKPDKGASNGTS